MYKNKYHTNDKKRKGILKRKINTIAFSPPIWWNKNNSVYRNVVHKQKKTE